MPASCPDRYSTLSSRTPDLYEVTPPGPSTRLTLEVRHNVVMVFAAPLAADLQTPYLVVDRDVLQANLGAMAARARDHGVALRPHAKTHKCLEIARRQLALGAAGLTVATVGGPLERVARGCALWPSGWRYGLAPTRPKV